MMSHWVVVMGMLAGLGGCGLVEAERKAAETPAGTYGGLKGQTVAIVIWADFQTRTSFNQIQLDMTRLLTGDLANMTHTVKDKEHGEPIPSLAGAQFLDPRSVIKYQREHPEVWEQPIAEVAPKLGVPRVIYIEISEFHIQDPQTPMLLAGVGKANLRVLEVAGGQAHLVFEEHDITAHFPPNAPEGVVQSEKVTPRTIYEGTVDVLADKIVARFTEIK
jgi:hypothetical protein